MAEERQGLVALRVVDQRDLEAIQRLAALCNARDGLDLKVSLALWTDEHERGWVNAFGYYAHGELIGYCSLDGDLEVELCGMVHPEHRRRGIGRSLLAAARTECARRNARELLLICEQQSSSGQAFLATFPNTYAFAEHEMDLRIAADTPLTATVPLEGLRFDQAAPGDVESIAIVTSAAFGDPLEQVKRRVEADLRHDPQTLFVVRLGSETVATLKLYTLPEKIGIYAVAVAPAYQRRGVARWMMLEAIEQARQRGHTRFGLEVNPGNAPALALYRSLGFALTTTYGYYQLPLG